LSNQHRQGNVQLLKATYGEWHPAQALQALSAALNPKPCAPACRAQQQLQQQLQSHVHAAQDACRRAAAVAADAADWQLSEAGIDVGVTGPFATEEPQQAHDTTAGEGVMHEDEVVAAAAAVVTLVDEFNTAGALPMHIPPLVAPAVP
jgi:hypothetical protein